VPQPDARPCLLIRVSTDDQDTRQQRHEALEWIHQQFGVTLETDAIFEEDGVSGRNDLADRPGLNAAYQACMAGRFTHLIVRKIDRSARNLAVMASIIRELDRVGVSFIAIMEQIDTRQFGSKLVAHMLLSFAEHFSDNLAEEVKKGKRKRKRLGLPNGHLPFGSASGAGGIPTRDTEPVTLRDGSTSTRYDGAVCIFTMAAEGMTAAEITRRMNQLGYTTHSHKGDRIFATTTVRRILCNRFYLGEIPRDKRHTSTDRGWLPGAHEPLIDSALWGRAQEQLARHAARPMSGRHASHPHPFGRGMVQCVTCAERGVTAYFHAKPDARKPFYPSMICSERAMRHMCGEPTVRECELESQMERHLARLCIPSDAREALLATYAAKPPPDATPDNAEAERARIQHALDALDAKLDVGRIDAATYRQKVRQLQSELAQIVDAPPAAPEVDVLRETAAYLADVVSLWRDADGWERAELVRLLFTTVWVHDRQMVRLDPAPAFTAWFQIIEGGAE